MTEVHALCPTHGTRNGLCPPSCGFGWPDTPSEPKPPRLGCELNAHRDLGFCAFCPGHDVYDEIAAWRLLAIQQRGVPDQPGRSS